MVKYAVPAARDAQYEAQLRTLQVSNKPSVGSQLFSDTITPSAEGAFKPSFETERFLHGKIREYTLRSAAHWADVRAVLPNRSAPSKLDHEHMMEVQDALVYRVVAESIDHAIGDAVFESIPKNLRVYVLARLIHDSDISVMNYMDAEHTHKEDRAQLQAKLNLRRILKRVGSTKHSSAVQMNVAGLLIAASLNNGRAVELDQHCTADQLTSAESRRMWAAFVVALTSPMSSAVSSKAVSQCSSTKTDEDNISAHSCKRTGSNLSKLQKLQKASLNSTVSRNGVVATTAEGFGTAPIWYQQSMATGPP